MIKLSGKKKLLVENFLVYGLGGMIGKIIPLIMLPLITRLMPDTYYFGVNDMVNLVSTFGTAIAIMGIYDALFRLFFENDNEEYKKQVCSTALAIVLANSLIVLLAMLIFAKPFASLMFSSSDDSNLIVLNALIIIVSAVNAIISAPVRMENKRKTFLVLNFITSILGYSLTIPLLLAKNYLYALPLSQFISTLLLTIIYYIITKKWFSFNKFNKEYAMELLKIGIPLMPTFLVYWIFNSFDRVMIKDILGLDAVGIYAIGAKVATVSQLIYQAFAQGWQYFAFSIMKDADNNTTISKVFEALLLITTLSMIFIMPFVDVTFSILFENSYVKGAEVFPYLFLSPLLLMLFQSIANQFLVIKKSVYILPLLLLGVVTNIGLNFILIPKLGVVGAGIATFLGYYVTVIVTVLSLNFKKLFYINQRIIGTLVILFGFTISLIFTNQLLLNCIISLLLIMVLYGKTIVSLKRLIKR